MAMTLCPGYDPYIVFQLDGSLYEGSNCGPSATAAAIDDATCGAKRSTAARIRELMRDTEGGTNMRQAAVVARQYFGVRLELTYRMPWAEYERERLKGRGAYIQVAYGPIADSRFRGSASFRAGHALYDTPSSRVRDSLADGRRAGIYRFAGEEYPRSLIRKAAGMLNLAPPGVRPALLGDGFINAAFTVDNEPSAWTITVGAGGLDWWRLIAGKAQRWIRGAVVRRPWTRHCTAPQFYAWPGHNPVSLVRILDGPGAGRYIAATAPRVKVEAIS